MTATSTRCAQCQAPSDTTLCTDCAIALRIELGDVPALLADLDITRSRQDQLTDPTNHGPASSENPLPYKTHIAEVAWVLHHTLHAWVVTIGGQQPPSLTTTQLGRHLLVNIRHIQVRVDAGELAGEVTSAIHQARHAIDRPNDRRQFLGPCGNQLPNGSECRHEVYGMAWKETTSCPSCGTEHHIATRQQWLLDIAHDRLGTSTEIAGFLRTAGVGCTPSQIRGYVARGRLVPAPDTNPPLYRMADVLAAIQDRYRHLKRPAS